MHPSSKSKISSMDEVKPRRHILIFPAPAQGHISSMLKLADLLCSTAAFNVTFLTPTYIHHRLSQHSAATSLFSRRSFRLLPMPDSPQEDIHPGSFDVKNWLVSLRSTAQPFLRDLLSSIHDQDEDDDASFGLINCVICDGILTFVLESGDETGVPVFFMRTLSACAFWVYFSLPDLIKSNQLPFHNDDLDLPIAKLTGMEGILRRRDLPSCCRSGLSSRSMQAIMHETLQTPRAEGLILNTFDRLEAVVLNQIRTRIPNLYTVGPLHAHLKNRAASALRSNSSSSLWEEDRSCLEWLDQQPSKSVIYVSFGSIVLVEKEAQREFWHGLVNSGKRFLWVMRPDSGGILPEIVEGGKERGRVMGWAPQEEVLAHEAVGGFLTHCGWNSTLESIVAGVPVICWPHFGDQQVNSRFVDEVWRIGLDMKDCCERMRVEKMVREVMEVRRDEFLQRAQDMANLARQSVEEGGTSHANLDRLIEDIRSLGTAK